jgi:hypothetical protein
MIAKGQKRNGRGGSQMLKFGNLDKCAPLGIISVALD